MSRTPNHIVYLIDDDGVIKYVSKRAVISFVNVVETKHELTDDVSQAKLFTEGDAASIRQQDSEFHYKRAVDEQQPKIGQR